MPKTWKDGTDAKRKKKQQVERGTEQSEINIEDFANVSEERASIISIVNGLEGQVETAFELKEVLEAELAATQKKLSEESAARAKLEQRVKSSELQAALAEQLREDISFIEQERNKLANLLAETQPQLEALTEQRDLLLEKVASAEANIKELEREKTTIEVQVISLKDKITKLERVHGEMSEVIETRQELDRQVQRLSSRLEASDMSNKALGKDLADTRETVQGLREEVKQMQEKLDTADNRTADLRIQFEDQQAANRELMETNTHLESEIKMLNVNYKAARNELDAFKNAMCDIRSEATQTSGRVRQRYFKPSPPKA